MMSCKGAAAVLALTACTRPAPAGLPAPVLSALECAHAVVRQHGFLAEESTNWFPWRPQPTGQTSFTVQRGDSLAGESVSISVLTNAATGSVEVQASASGFWTNAGQPIRSTSTTAELVARLVREECNVAGAAA